MSKDQPNPIFGYYIKLILIIGFKLTDCYKLITSAYDLPIQQRSSVLLEALTTLTSSSPLSQPPTDLWDNGIVPYRFTQNFDDWSRLEVRGAMDLIESVSCVKFIEAQQSEENYVLISQGWGCSSEIGKVGGKQDLYLDTPYCVHRGTVLHELLHTLGLMHEHSRPDRDAYININWSNIDEKHRRNFKAQTSFQDDLYSDEPYDYKSVMHYSSSMWSIDENVPTITPKDPSILITDLGYHLENKSLSPEDVNKLKKLYKCPSHRNLII